MASLARRWWASVRPKQLPTGCSLKRSGGMDQPADQPRPRRTPDGSQDADGERLWGGEGEWRVRMALSHYCRYQTVGIPLSLAFPLERRPLLQQAMGYVG